MFDLIVIGGGPAGYLAAERAGHAGLKVVLFEKNSLGGVCLNEGCIPSKALLNSAKLYEHALHSQAYGVKAEGVSIDQPTVVARRGKVVKTLVSGVGAKMRGAHVTVVKENGKRIPGSGRWTLFAGFGGPDPTTEKLTGQKAFSVTIR